MPTARRDSPARGGGRNRLTAWIAPAALCAPLLLLLVVTARTWSAERKYAAVTQKVIHDYAGIAAWQYARRANTDLHDEIMRAFSGIAKGHQRTGALEALHGPAVILAARPTARSPLLDSSRLAFTYDADTRDIQLAGSSIDAPTRMMLERRLSETARAARNDDEPHRVFFDSAGGKAHVVALWVISAPDRPARGIYGVVSDPRALQPRFREVIREADLLPAARLREPLEESDIAIRITARNGAVMFASGPPPGATAATDTATLQNGELRATIDLSPRLASALLVGGAPASQLPSLVLMILLASLLAAVGLLHERRTRELARLRSRFVANVSHELRTPLAQISMFAETLALGRERNAGEGRHFASIILAEARRLTGVVESVLRFSRLESSHDKLRVERANVAREIADAIESFAPVAEASDVSISADLEDTVYARLDRAAFRQVILNLLDNAVKHAGRGASVHVAAGARDGDMLLTVDDSGRGVPEAWRERVFEPFIRADDVKAAGAGIGLAVVRELVHAHGGRVWIEQSPRGGARFIVAIPTTGVAAPHAQEEPVGAGT